MMRLAVILSALAIALATAAPAGAATDARICGEPARTADGRIARSKAVLRDFKTLHPCPATGLRTGPCQGWAIDHVIPLACGGCDSMENLQWLKLTIKSCAGADCKDRWERAINCLPVRAAK